MNQIQPFDFSGYKPINWKQAEFHKSTSKNKCLLGGVGAGKTMPGIYESLMVCHGNPGCEFAVFRNTWDSLRDNVEKEFVKVSELVGAKRTWKDTKHDLYLTNNVTVRFRPLTLNIEQIKGMNVCGFFIDDPDVDRFSNVIGFLYTRLRNPPWIKANFFESIITANWEGRNWLWQKYIRNRPMGGNDKFAYWICKTEENPELPDDYIENLSALHSEDWMNRYVYCDINTAYAGLIYPEYDPEVHHRDLGWIKKKTGKSKDLLKIMAVDIGTTAPTVVIKMATDFNNIYVYDEWYKRGIHVDVLGEYLNQELRKDNYRAVIIDPSSNKDDPTSGTSVRKLLKKEWGVHTKGGNNNFNYGREIIKSMLTVRKGETRWLIDPTDCPHCCQELDTYKWKEQGNSVYDDVYYKPVPIDRDNDCCDTMRYGACYLKDKIKGIDDGALAKERNKRMWANRIKDLPMYNENRAMGLERPDVKTLLNIHKKALGKKIAEDRRKKIKKELLTR